jgi:hypothetical protein
LTGDSKRDVPSNTVQRRHVLKWFVGGIGFVVVAGGAGVELVDHGVLPGKQTLDEIDGACSVPTPTLSFHNVGPSESGHFYSAARQRSVGYTIGYPPRYQTGTMLPLVVMLHGYGQNHATALVGMTPAWRCV